MMSRRGRSTPIAETADRVVGAKRPAPGRTGATPDAKRKQDADVPTPVRERVVAEYRALRPPGAQRLPRGVMGRLLASFRGWNLKARWVQARVKEYDDQVKEGKGPMEIDLSRNRVGRVPTNAQFTVPIGVHIVTTNDKAFGRLSYRRLTALVNEKFDKSFSEAMIRRWCLEMRMKKRRRYIAPKLSIKHKLDRLDWALQHVERCGPQLLKFSDNKNTAHGDEGWFYMLTDGAVCRVFPNKDGEYVVPGKPKVFHKSRMPKLMFLVVTARPRPEYKFDGKIGIWCARVARRARRVFDAVATVGGSRSTARRSGPTRGPAPSGASRTSWRR